MEFYFSTSFVRTRRDQRRTTVYEMVIAILFKVLTLFSRDAKG